MHALKFKLISKITVFLLMVFGVWHSLLASELLNPNDAETLMISQAMSQMGYSELDADFMENYLDKIKFKNKFYFILRFKKQEDLKDYGWALALFYIDKKQARLLNVTRGAMDSENLDLIFKQVKSDWYLFGVVGGDDYLWGIQVYQLTEKGLKYFGILDAIPQTDSIESSFNIKKDSQGNPTILFTTPITLNPGEPNETTISPTPQTPVEFRYDGKKFVLSSSVLKPNEGDIY